MLVSFCMFTQYGEPSAATKLAKSSCMFLGDPFQKSLAQDRLTTHLIQFYESCHGESVIQSSLNS